MTRGKSSQISEPAFYRTRIKDWPVDERPREKLLHRGAEVLSEAELLAILVRTGSKGVTAVDLARKLLAEGRSLRDLARMTVADFAEYGVGAARACSLVAAFEIVRRLPFSDGEEKPVLRSPLDVAKRFGPKLRDLQHEEFWSLILNSASRLIAEVRITTGTLNASLVHPRECFQPAIKWNGASVIFVHNHPSGNPEPSQEDLAITKQLAEAGKILGIPVHDHIIVAGHSATSLAERMLL